MAHCAGEQYCFAMRCIEQYYSIDMACNHTMAVPSYGHAAMVRRFERTTTMAKVDYAVAREFAHRTHGEIGAATLQVMGTDKVVLNGKELPGRSVEYLLTFALQSLQDAYAGAKSSDEARAMFEKKLAAITDGTIGVRGSSGGGVSELTKVSRSVAREMLRAAFAKSGKSYGDFTALSAADQNEKLDAIIEKHRDVVEGEAKKRIAAKAKVADAVDLDDIGL